MKIAVDPVAEAYRIRALRGLSPEKRLLMALELSEFTRRLFEEGVRQARPDLSEEELRQLLRRRLDLCHNTIH